VAEERVAYLMDKFRQGGKRLKRASSGMDNDMSLVSHLRVNVMLDLPICLPPPEASIGAFTLGGVNKALRISLVKRLVCAISKSKSGAGSEGARMKTISIFDITI
jgi:hypothetical protein